MVGYVDKSSYTFEESKSVMGELLPLMRIVIDLTNALKHGLPAQE